MKRRTEGSGLGVALVLAATLVLGGCVSSRVEESRQASTGMIGDEALVILGRASYNEHETKESFTDCMAQALSRGAQPLRLIPAKQFQDELYPWLEPRIAPASAKELGKLFAQPGVRDQIESSNVRYLAWIDGDTITTDKGGSCSCTVGTFGAGCFGVSFWEQDASYEAAVWDLQNLTTAGELSADANGTSFLAGLVVPIPMIARPGNAACKALARQLKEFLGES